MIVARSVAELRALPPGLYIGIGDVPRHCWVTPDEPVVKIQRRINAHKMDPEHKPLHSEDLLALESWLTAYL